MQEEINNTQGDTERSEGSNQDEAFRVRKKASAKAIKL